MNQSFDLNVGLFSFPSQVCFAKPVDFQDLTFESKAHLLKVVDRCVISAAWAVGVWSQVGEGSQNLLRHNW